MAEKNTLIIPKPKFTRLLMQWHELENDRVLPWKSEKDPYRIWLSEVILQQTRAEQGLPYYLNFIAKYPTVRHLADAQDDEVFKLWQGLGYYNRCRNLLATARLVTSQYQGSFPDTYEGLLQLTGVGPYTAAAIASFAFNRPAAVVDGNVVRVLARTHGIAEPADTTAGKKTFAHLAASLLDTDHPGQYNQAIMDFGATMCKPKLPLCGQCPLKPMCSAHRDGTVDVLPVKGKKVEVETRYFHYFIFADDAKILLGKRTGKDIWQGLHQPYLVETGAPEGVGKVMAGDPFLRQMLGDAQPKPVVEGAQKLTHRIIKSRFYDMSMVGCNFTPPSGYAFYTLTEAAQLALPKTVAQYLTKYVS
jgi:A/G-specific adenine glycosylase